MTLREHADEMSGFPVSPNGRVPGTGRALRIIIIIGRFIADNAVATQRTRHG
jgi:hypothetical protein